MATMRQSGVMSRVQRLFESGATGALSDAQLLGRFLDRGDPGADEAFEVLVRRHGPMVLRVCQRSLDDYHLAQDAFQATFLVLARKARTIRRDDALAGWLLGVARRLAWRARAEASRRRRLDEIGAELAAGRGPAGLNGPLSVELRDALDQLPERFRRPLELCYLEGMTHDEAAAELCCPVGTVRSRLARGREALRRRLGEASVLPPVLVPMSGPQLSHSLVRSTLCAVRAPRFATENALNLMKGAVAMMTRMQLFRAAGLTLAASFLAGGVILARTAAMPPEEASRATLTPAAAAADDDPVKAELERLSGRWRRVASEGGGKDWMPEGSIDPESPGLVVVFEGDAWRMIGEDGNSLQTSHRITVDPATKPKRMTLGAPDDPGQVLYRAIYKLDADTLTLCIQFNSEKPLPDDFTTAPDDGRVLDVYKRVKP